MTSTRESWRQNPLRVLDCKREECVEVTSKGPMLIDHICDACRAHFDAVVEGLRAIGIATTFSLLDWCAALTTTTAPPLSSWPTPFESAQNSMGGGGRYDQLAEELGGKPTSGIGFGSGVERLLLAREAEGVDE